MLLGSREPWKLADYIKSFNWLNYYRGQVLDKQPAWRDHPIRQAVLWLDT